MPLLRIVISTRREALDVPVAGPTLEIDRLSEDQQLEIARAIDGFTPSFSAVMRAAVNLPSGSLLAINNTDAPASGGPENPLREKRQEGLALRPRVLAQAVATRRRRSTTQRCWCTACTAGAK
jgi:hypothetical protein